MKSNYLLFLVAGKVFGARLVGAIEIVAWRRPRPLPRSHAYVEGLIDYRKTIYPVFSLAQRLGLTKPGPIGFTTGAPQEQEGERSIILLEENRIPFGIVVDAIVKMAMIEEPSGAPVKSAAVDPQFVKGIVYEDNQEVMILDFERLFNVR